MRVVLDTNVLVSGLAYPGGPPGRIVSAWRAGALDLAVSEFMLDELARVLPSLAARTGFTAADVQDFLDLLRALARLVEVGPDSLATACASGLRDPNDSPILVTLIAAAAQWLVTGDKDLLALADRYPIVTPADFCARYQP